MIQEAKRDREEVFYFLIFIFMTEKTIVLDGQKYNLVPADEETTKTQEPPKKKKWEPKGGQWYVSCYGSVLDGYIEYDSRMFGIEYPTKELAEKARDAMRIHNLLIARKMEECPNEGEYFIWLDYEWWGVNKLPSFFHPELVLFTLEVAKKICEELNDPETNFIS